MKTAEEIKKALDCCRYLHPVCEECPYYPTFCDNAMIEDALEYIYQLEAERDAAVALIPRACAYCKWYGTKHGGFHPDCKNPNGCRNVSGINTGWQWRGVQREE